MVASTIPPRRLAFIAQMSHAQPASTVLNIAFLDDGAFIDVAARRDAAIADRPACFVSDGGRAADGDSSARLIVRGRGERVRR